jgi:hypothetical protein
MVFDAEDSIIGWDGSIRHFSRRAFVQLACDLQRCFICGAPKTAKPFNDEHVIPDWILRRFTLHSRYITLPNAGRVMYGRYTLRCCIACNERLGQFLETPISQLFRESFDETAANLTQHAVALYQWLCLLFIKVLLKDRDIRADPDFRNPSKPLGDLYDWDGVHHIHSVARAPSLGTIVEPTVPGTTLVFRTKTDDEAFDFGDLSDYSTICLRLGSVGIVSVLNDCGLVARMVSGYLSRISGPLNAIQLREVAARLAYGNELLRTRPQFWTEIDGEELRIRAACPKSWQRGEIARANLGEVMAFACGPLLLQSKTPQTREKLEQLKRGEIQFLYHDDGSFIE